eukprot:scaffold127947_cov49-Prasinocladus_malaysianus.AAC.1
MENLSLSEITKASAALAEDAAGRLSEHAKTPDAMPDSNNNNNNPVAGLTRLGVDPREIAHQIAAQYWKEMRPLRFLVGLVWRVTNKYRILILGLSGLFTFNNVRQRAQTALEERIE